MPKKMHTRTREWSKIQVPWYFDGYLFGTRESHQEGVYSFSGSQVTNSEGHLWPPRKGEGLGDRGGPFWTTKQEIENPNKIVEFSFKATGNDWNYKNKSLVLPLNPATVGFPPSSESSDTVLDKWGATQVARSEPTNSAADASTFLAELYRDGIPSLIGHTLWSGLTKRALRSTADEYLNVAFGWLPMLKDITKFSESIRHANQVLDQYERDSGKLVRRHRRVPSEKVASNSTVVSNVKMFKPGVVYSEFLGPSGDVLRSRETERERSFAGAFTYYLPSDYDSRRNLRDLASKADKLFGLNLSPEAIWEATPWSWAVDWFSNTQDVIHNVTAFGNHGLVMPYGYVTERISVTDTYIHTGKYFTSSYEVKPLILRTISQKRRQANPFGFGLTWEGLSSFQKSILLALGISKH
jgi:hypothetical protein